MMKNILLLNGNPKKHSLAKHFIDEYEVEARKHADVRRFNLSDMDFNPSLDTGYESFPEIEPCLKKFQKRLSWANHLVIASPIWWGGLPAKLKGIFDRTLLPNFAFKYEGSALQPKPLFKGKSARLILTMDTPEEFVKEQAQPVLEQLDRFTLQFCGISPVQVNLFGSVVMADENTVNDWIETVRTLGAMAK
jgi:putative NADPH-quinone reductase